MIQYKELVVIRNQLVNLDLSFLCKQVNKEIDYWIINRYTDLLHNISVIVQELEPKQEEEKEKEKNDAS